MSGYAFSLSFVAAFVVSSIVASSARGAPSVSLALGLKPVQSDVDYETPTAEQIEKCSIKSEVNESTSGWVVYGEFGQTLRRFLDTNRDGKVDLWCYYKNGVEVYRDIDANFNEKADQYRWLSTAGTRWGLDPDEDNVIDSWKMISPEEVTAEVVAALRDKDAARFRRLLLTSDELQGLGFGPKQREEIAQRIAAASKGFPEFANSQKLVTSHTQWLQFGATRPGILPAGTDGSTKDVLIYDNVAAIIDTQGTNGQLAVGALISVGAGWRIVDLPRSESGDSFFLASALRSQHPETTFEGGMDEQMQKLLSDLDRIDKSLPSSPAQDRAKLHGERADLLARLAERAHNEKDRAAWVRQFAETVGAAGEAGEFPDAVRRLKGLADKVSAWPSGGALIPLLRYRMMMAEYTEKIQQLKPEEYPKFQEQWLKDLEAFIKDHPRAEEAADAMLQLAIAQEFVGKEDDALAWYARIAKDFPNASLAAKAAGAKRRLESVGQSMDLQGKTLTDAAYDVARFRGQVVLIHYWATWCEPCKRDMQTLKALQAKFATRGFSLVGVNLDSDAGQARAYVQAERLSWPQLHEPGGLDSRLANEMGILTLPTMILLDKQGRVVRRSIHVDELERELSTLLK